MLRRAYILDPAIVTVHDSRTRLVPGGGRVDAFWVIIQLRSIGTATYVGLGTSGSQESRLLGPGDFVIIDVPPGYVFDASGIYAIADVDNQAVLEITVMVPDVSPTGVSG